MAKKLINRIPPENRVGSNISEQDLIDYSIGAFLTDEENRTVWINGMPYGNAYISFNEDGIVNTRQPKHGEIFNDFEHNKAEGHYSHAEGGTYVNTVYNNTKITYLETPVNRCNYSVPYTSVLFRMIQVMANPVMKIPLYVVIKNEGRLDLQDTTINDSDNRIADNEPNIPSEVNIDSTTLTDIAEVEYTKANETKYYILDDFNTDNENIYFNVATSFESEPTTLPDYCDGKTMYFHYYYAYNGSDGWTEATRDGAHAEGISQAHGVMSHTEGFANRSYEDYSHTEGVGNEVYGLAGHAEGDRNIVTNSAPYSHAEGHMNIAKADSVHVEGRNNLGNNTGAHVEGGRNVVNGIYGHAEGYGNKVNNDYGHAEGYRNEVNNENGHAEGENTVANGKASHTEGVGTITANEGEHAEGKYNYTDIESGFISTVGIGSSDDDRKNAISVFSDGRVYLGKTYELVDEILNEYDPCLYSGKEILNESKSLQRILAEAEQKLIEISYNQLVRLRNNNLLIPGQFYKINDFSTSVDVNIDEVKSIGVKSAGNQFDVIVLATSKNTLNENAYADYKIENNFDIDKNLVLNNGVISYTPGVTDYKFNTYKVAENGIEYVYTGVSVNLASYFYTNITDENGNKKENAIILKTSNNENYLYDYENFENNDFCINRFKSIQILSSTSEQNVITFKITSPIYNFAVSKTVITYIGNYSYRSYKYYDIITTITKKDNVITVKSELTEANPTYLAQYATEFIDKDELKTDLQNYIRNNNNFDTLTEESLKTCLSDGILGEDFEIIYFNKEAIRSDITLSSNNDVNYIFPNIVKIINNEPILITEEYIQRIKEYYTGPEEAQKPNFNLQAWKIKYSLDNNAYQSKREFLEHLIYKSDTNLSYFENDNLFNINNFTIGDINNWTLDTNGIITNADTIKQLKYKWDIVNCFDYQNNDNEQSGNNEQNNDALKHCILSNRFSPLSNTDESYFAYLCEKPTSFIYNNVENNVSDDFKLLTNFKTIKLFNEYYPYSSASTLYIKPLQNLYGNKIYRTIDDLSYIDEYGKGLTDNVKKWYDVSNSESLYYIKTYSITNSSKTEKTIVIPYKINRTKFNNVKLIYNEDTNFGLLGFNILNTNVGNEQKNYINKIQYKESEDSDQITYLIRLGDDKKPQVYAYNNEEFYIYEAFRNVEYNESYGYFEITNVIGVNEENLENYSSANELIGYKQNANQLITYEDTYIIAKNINVDTNNVTLEINEDKQYTAYIIKRDTIYKTQNGNNSISYFIDYELNNGTNYGEPLLQEINYKPMFNGIAYDLLEIDNYELSIKNNITQSVKVYNTNYSYNTYTYNKIMYNSKYYTFYRNPNEPNSVLIFNLFENDNFSLTDINTNNSDDFAISITKLFSSKDTSNISNDTNDNDDIVYQQNILSYTFLKFIEEINQAASKIEYFPLCKISTGYIYHMIDEYNNSFNYDVSNIMFTDNSATPVYHYTFCKSNELTNEYNALIDGNIRNNTFISSEYLQKNIFYTKNKENAISMLNNTFKNASIICSSVKDIDIINSQFTNVSGTFSPKNNNEVLSISNSLFSNCVNKTFKNSTYNGVIIRNLQDNVEYNGDDNQLKPIFSINNFRVYENTTSSFLNAAIYNSGQEIKLLDTKFTTTTPTNFSVTGQVNLLSNDNWNVVKNSKQISGFNISCKTPSSGNNGILLKDNKYISLGYLTVGFVYYWRGRGFSNENKRPDIELQVSNLSCTCTYQPQNNNKKTKNFTINYPNTIVLSNVYRSTEYKMSIVIHLGLNINDFGSSEISEYYGKKYLMLENGSNFEFSFNIPAQAIRIQAQNDAEDYYEVKPNIADIQWTSYKPSILTNNLDVKNTTFVQKIINTNFDYNTSLSSKRSIINPDDFIAEMYQITDASTDSMFAICTDGIVIKNTTKNYITAQIIESGGKVYPIIKINGSAPGVDTATKTIYSNSSNS